MHGVVNNKGTDLHDFNQRTFLDFKKFEGLLKDRPAKFVDIDQAIEEGKGDVLTIDDARMGGLDAALLAAEYGHYVSLFINPYYIENQCAYYFSYLNYLVENISAGTEVELGGQIYPIREMNDRYRLRQRLKYQLRQLKAERERISVLQSLANQTGIRLAMDELPDYARTVTKEQLQQLTTNPYIRIENHGWTHTCISVLTDEEIQEEVQRSLDWIKAACGRKPAYYVIPFGDRIVPPSCTLPAKLFLLEDPRFYPGFLGKHFYNRFTLQV